MESSTNLIRSATLVSQGAEAKVYKAILHPSNDASEAVPISIKHRFRKQYRHPTLDASLTKSRIAGEARAIARCLRSGVQVPALRLVDPSTGLLGIEWIQGRSVRAILGGGAEDEAEAEDSEIAEDVIEEEAEGLGQEEEDVDRDKLMQLIGTEIAKMHLADIIHGDLTTSNMMLRSSPSPPELLLIDFGLSFTSTLIEDKAVDLYVLERAFSSTHPDAEPLFASVLKAYEIRMGKDWKNVKRRLDDVRLRGRKRSMVG